MIKLNWEHDFSTWLRFPREIECKTPHSENFHKYKLHYEIKVFIKKFWK